MRIITESYGNTPGGEEKKTKHTIVSFCCKVDVIVMEVYSFDCNTFSISANSKPLKGYEREAGQNPCFVTDTQ